MDQPINSSQQPSSTTEQPSGQQTDSQSTNLPTTPQAPIRPTQKQGKKGLKLLLIVLITIILGIVGYKYILPKLTPISTPSPAPLPTFTPTTQPSPNPSDEVTYYTNNKYGVSFIHPSSWGIKDLGNTLVIAPKETIKTIPDGDFGGGSFLTMTISLLDTPYEPLITDEFANVETNELMKIGGKNAEHFTVTVLEEGPGFKIGEVYQIYRLQNENNYYNITLLLIEYKEIFNEILSSLEFF